MPKLNRFYYPQLFFVLLITILSFLTLNSVAYTLIESQLQALFIGILVFSVIAVIDYNNLKKFSKTFYFIGFLFLLLTFLFGKAVFGSSRWLSIGGLTFQTSEIAKISIILFLSSVIAKNSKYIHKVNHFIFVAFLILLYILFILLQPDLGTSLIVTFACVGILFFANLNKAYFIFGISLIGILSNPLWNLLQDYQQKRILIFINPLLDVQGAGYNVIQSKIAIGAGQMFGAGVGRGVQSHLQYLPAYWTDFIFASFAEEWGFLGVLLLLFLYFLFLASILYIMFKTSDTFGFLLAGGIFFIFFAQFFINVGMNLGLMPVTGITLPFFSYGGTSFVVSMVMLGLLQSIWVHRKIT